MSFRHMAWAMETKIGDPLAKLLLVALADRADKDTGQCWPSLARLCEDTEMSMATVTRRLHYLEEHRFIQREPITMNLSENNKSMLIDFEEFWQVYPRKVGKGQARVAFKTALRKATKDELVSAASTYAESVRSTEQNFIPHASTWLNGERWLDQTTQSSWGDI
jgi:DNA-binding transcriptional MocR family regulator